jgi:hypothetical protein
LKSNVSPISTENANANANDDDGQMKLVEMMDALFEEEFLLLQREREKLEKQFADEKNQSADWERQVNRIVDERKGAAERERAERERAERERAERERAERERAEREGIEREKSAKERTEREKAEQHKKAVEAQRPASVAPPNPLQSSPVQISNLIQTPNTAALTNLLVVPKPYPAVVTAPVAPVTPAQPASAPASNIVQSDREKFSDYIPVSTYDEVERLQAKFKENADLADPLERLKDPGLRSANPALDNVRKACMRTIGVAFNRLNNNVDVAREEVRC